MWVIPFAVGVLLVAAITPALLETPVQGQGISNETCLECHSDPNLLMVLDNGELMSVYIDEDEYLQSVHGDGGYACVQCHTDIGDYPHPESSYADRRDLSLQLYNACFRCHSGQYEKTLDSAHQKARDEGVRDAAICTDCHGSHDTRRITDPETHQLTPEAHVVVPLTCAQCHNAIYEKYLDSVHGSALAEGNPDVPTCIDCHGVHSIEDPTTAAFRLQSPAMCADCHAEAELMEEYDLSTDVLDTYVADFHGTTVKLFEKTTPDAETNKPVCYDCHGIHDIKRTDDPEKGLHVRENILARCQVCHPDATANFPDSWLSHYIPSPDQAPLVYYVNLFYSVLIPVVVGGMTVLVGLDVFTGIRLRRKGRSRTVDQVEPNLATKAQSEVDESFRVTFNVDELKDRSSQELREDDPPTTPMDDEGNLDE